MLGNRTTGEDTSSAREGHAPVLIDFASVVQLVGGDAVKEALGLPGKAGYPVDGPPHFYRAVLWLPYALDIHIQPAEEELAVEAERPEESLVVLHAVESVPRVPEGDVFPVDVICRGTINPVGCACLSNCPQRGPTHNSSLSETVAVCHPSACGWRLPRWQSSQAPSWGADSSQAAAGAAWMWAHSQPNTAPYPRSWSSVACHPG